METDTSRLLRRADRFQVVLIGEGLLIGGIAGFVVLLYRMALEYAGSGLTYILDFAKGHPARMAGWFAVLVILSRVVGKLVTFEPMISGSGIPQLEGEMVGKLTEKWWRVLPAKFLGGFLCIFGGLALGREGPSIQLGAMVGQAVSRGLFRGTGSTISTASARVVMLLVEIRSTVHAGLHGFLGLVGALHAHVVILGFLNFLVNLARHCVARCIPYRMGQLGGWPGLIFQYQLGRDLAGLGVHLSPLDLLFRDFCLRLVRFGGGLFRLADGLLQRRVGPFFLRKVQARFLNQTIPPA